MDESGTTLFVRIFQLAGFLQLNRTGTIYFHYNKILLSYSILLLIIFCLNLIYLLKYSNYLDILTDDNVGNPVDYIHISGTSIAHFISIFESIFRYKRQRSHIEKTSELDRLFHSNLNANLQSNVFQSKLLKRFTMMFVLYGLIQLYILGIIIHSGEYGYIHFWITFTISLLMCALRYFQAYATVSTINWRFEILNKCLSDTKLNSSDEITKIESQRNGKHGIFQNGLRLYKSNFDNTAYYRLLILRDIYHRLSELTKIFNKTFGISILANIGNDFLSITANCYWIFIATGKVKKETMDWILIAGSVLSLSPNFLNVILITASCYWTVQSANKTALLVHKIPIDTSNDNHNTFIEQFSLQLLHQKIVFSAFGFFTIDLSLLYTIAGATTTYLVILIQFYMNSTKV